MIEVIYREDVSEDTIREPRNVTQIGSADPKYRIYMEDAVLTCIRKRNGAEDEVHYGLLLGELKRAAGTTYLFIRGMVRAEKKRKDAGMKESGRENPPKEDLGWRNIRKKGSGEDDPQKKDPDRENPEKTERRNEKKKDGGSGVVALERLTQDRQRMRETEYLTQDRQRMEKNAGEWPKPGMQSAELSAETPELEESATEENPIRHTIEFDGDTWTMLYEDINRYFPDMEILGWYASFPFLNVAGFDLCRQTHDTHFSGADKVLFLCDRTEREENFYRPDGAELRETEGYFTFFEKNDAMQVYSQDKEPAEAASDAADSGEERRGELRQGTVGEAPRKKWNISAASILVTAALLAAVLIVNQYNGRLKSEGADPVDGTAKEEASTLQALAVDGQVMEAGTEGDGNTGEDDNSTAAGITGGDDNSTASGNTGANDDSTTAGNAGEDGDNTSAGNTGGDDNSTAAGNAGGDDNSTTAGNAEGDDNTVTTGITENRGDNTVTEENGTGTGEDETVQTGSRVPARYYTVQNGETLYSICMDVYKTSAMVEIVRALNGIGEDYAIQAGQKILLP